MNARLREKLSLFAGCTTKVPPVRKAIRLAGLTPGQKAAETKRAAGTHITVALKAAAARRLNQASVGATVGAAKACKATPGSSIQPGRKDLPDLEANYIRDLRCSLMGAINFAERRQKKRQAEGRTYRSRTSVERFARCQPARIGSSRSSL